MVNNKMIQRIIIIKSTTYRRAHCDSLHAINDDFTDKKTTQGR
jgi:hypothetical protein